MKAKKTRPRKKKRARAPQIPQVQPSHPVSPSVQSTPAETRAQQILKLATSPCHCVASVGGRNFLHGDCSEHGVPYLLVTAEVYLDGRGAEQEALKKLKGKIDEVSSLLNVGHSIETKVRVLYGKMPTT